MTLPSPRIYDNGVCCDMFKKLVDYIEVLLEDEIVDSQIISLAKNLCETFSSPYSSLCKSIVDQYVPLIISYIEQGIQSADICTSIGLCDEVTGKVVASKNVFPRVQRNKQYSRPRNYVRGDAETCETCKRWYKWATDHLLDMTQEALWMLVNVECPKVPYLKYFCQIINEDNIKTFIDLIKAAAPPEVACGWTDLC